MLGKPKEYTKRFSELKDNNFETVGREGVLFAKLYKNKIPIPNGFVVTTYTFDDYLLFNQIVEEILNILKDVKPFVYSSARDAYQQIANLILTGKFSTEMEKSILKEYALLSGKEVKSLVSVEASHIIDTKFLPESKTFHDRFLYVRGEEEILNKIKFVWLSLFSPEAIELRTNSYYKGALSSAVLIKRMVIPEISGKIYSIPPITNEKDLLEIHAYFGIEDPDSNIQNYSDIYKVDIKKKEIKEKQIIPQTTMLVRSGGKESKNNPKLLVEISKEWQRKPKLEDEKIIEYSKKFLDIEAKLAKPLEVTWGVQAGSWFITEIKEVVKKENKIELDSQKEEMFLEKINEINNGEDKPKPDLKAIEKEIEKMLKNQNDNEYRKDFTNNIEFKIKEEQREKKQKVSKWSSEYKLKTKIYLDISALNSAELHSIEYFDGVFLDGTEIVLNHDLLPEDVFNNQSNYYNLVNSYNLDISVASQNANNKPLIYQFSNITDFEYKLLGKNLDEVKFVSDERFIENPNAMVAELTAIKKSKEEHSKENLSISFPGVRSVRNLKDLKKIVNSIGIKRSENQKFYVDISIPSLIYDLKEMEEDLIDGVIINYETLIRLSVFRKEIRPVDHEILFNVLKDLKKTCSIKKIEIAVLIDGSNLEAIKNITHLNPSFVIFKNIPNEEVISSIKDIENSTN